MDYPVNYLLVFVNWLVFCKLILLNNIRKLNCYHLLNDLISTVMDKSAQKIYILINKVWTKQHPKVARMDMI